MSDKHQPSTSPSAPFSPEETEAAMAANTSDEMDRLNAELAELKAKSADLADQFLRAKADTENARRRAEEEVSKARKFSIEGFAESLLAVADSLDAALAMPEATAQQLREGTDATLRQLLAAFERNKLLAINPSAGTKFDPHFHQAISVVPAAQEANSVVMVLQKGYLIADRVLRPALVTVAGPQ
ncbi:nucleotide exchange factor GrpE [Simplicispira psychrophila]|uniref:nucleotide exchange factor GrpE n=1 Tax=Simplicispira psychrophila TaxID=80882 RepID=UPI0004892EBB|nr:nucleotide exchange factor GrpE [Simplicispira psychrophila]